jgi:hypothetical protein
MIDALCLLFGLAGQWLLGWVLSGWLMVGFRRTNADNWVPLVERTGLAFVLGIGATAWILFLWSEVGGLLNRQTSLALAAMGWACGLPTIIADWLQQRTSQNSIREARAAADQESAFCRLCQIALGALFFSALVQTLLTPQRFWDERAIFAIKAAVLFEDRTIHSRDLAEPLFAQGHPRYPLLIPLAEQHLDALVGRVDDRLSKIVFPMLYFGLVLTAAGALSRRLTRSAAWLTAVLMATIPALMPDDYGFLCGQADAPVGCFHGITLLYLWDAIEQCLAGRLYRRRWIGTIAVAGIFGGLTAFTKDEGIAFLMVDSGILSAILIVSALRSAAIARRQSNAIGAPPDGPTMQQMLLVVTIFLGTAILLLAPWFLHRRGLPLKGEMNYFGRMSLSLLIERLSTLAWTIPHLAQRMFGEWSEWGLQWWLMVAALIAAPRRACRRPSQLLLLLDVLGTLSALVVAGMLAPVRLEEHIGGSSHRFLMQIAPIAVLFMAGQVAPRRDAVTRDET